MVGMGKGVSVCGRKVTNYGRGVRISVRKGEKLGSVRGMRGKRRVSGRDVEGVRIRGREERGVRM